MNSNTKRILILTVVGVVAALVADCLGNAQEIDAPSRFDAAVAGRRFLDDDGSGEEKETPPWSPLCGACQTPTNIIIPLFFLGWNVAMANTMVPTVIIPMSHCEWSGVQWILVFFPHWYAGLLMPAWVAGLPTAAFVALPYAFHIWHAQKKGLLGCCPPTEASAGQYAAAVDRDGVRVAPGDSIEVEACGKWRAATLVRMRADDQTWRVRHGKVTQPGYAAHKLRQVGSARPGEGKGGEGASANATVAAQQERIAELEAQVKNLSEWQARQQEQAQAPVAAAAAVAVPEAVPIPPAPGVAPPLNGAWRPHGGGPTGGPGRAQVYMTGEVVDVVTL